MKLPERIKSRIVKERGVLRSPCWIWTGATRHGYAAIWGGDRVVIGHRLTYEMLVGPIPEGLTLDHLCRATACINPGHTEPVSRAENLRRSWHFQ